MMKHTHAMYYFWRRAALCSLCVWSTLAGGLQAQGGKVQTFPLDAVRLLPSDFLQAQQVDAQYILALDADRLLSPFLKEAGIAPVKPAYGNWESDGLDGHTCGHYITALAQMAVVTKDPRFEEKLNYVIGWLDKCQQAHGNGYVGGTPRGNQLWAEIQKGNVAEIFKRWVPWYNIHKTYAGLWDAWRLLQHAEARRILLGMGEWAISLTSQLTDAQMQHMLGNEHGGMNEVFAAMADMTGDERYTVLSERFAHRALLDPLLQGKDALTGMHANTQIPKVVGFMRYGMLTHNEKWIEASDFFWQTVVKTRSVAFGGNSVREHFNAPTDFGPMLDSKEGPETCNSYNMLKLSKALFEHKASVQYLDYYEKTLYNHILSSQHPEGGFVYFTPIHPGHYRVYSQAQATFWCCVGSGLENHGKYGELIYACDSSSLYLNLFIPSVLHWKERGLTLTQQTRFPYQAGTRLVWDAASPQSLTLRLRQPAWLAAPMQVQVNGKKVSTTTDAGGFLCIARVWKKGDVVTLTLPMETRTEVLPDGSPWMSFVHGPVVLAAITDTTRSQMPGLVAEGTRWGHIAHGKLLPHHEAPLLVLPTEAPPKLDLPAVQRDALTFSPAAYIYQDTYKHLTLMPFYKLHDARYMLYWPYTTRSQLPTLFSDLAQRAEAKRALEAATLDVVYPGEQQPEADHRMQEENTRTGNFREKHFRTGKGWFSYDLRNETKAASRIQFTCYGAERDRAFELFINGDRIQSFSLDGSRGNAFFDTEVSIPEQLRSSQTLTVRFQAAQGASIASIYEVRLLR